ncbi:MAG: alpha-amylase family glycosyl hydrolase [Chitinophagaceae bacterium]
MDTVANNSWIKNTNIYEVNVRQYTPEGTFNAFAAHLPRLKDMGVQTLWFMPVTPISEKEKKGVLGSPYACSDYTAINPEFGTMADFKSLVNKAHSMGFKVIIDWVANHTGWDHRWTKEHPDWFEKDGATGDFKRASGMDDIIELDFKNPALRRAMIDAMKFWIEEADIDGFRADLAFWVELDFWQEAKPELEKVKPLFWLGELDPLEKPEYMSVFDAAYTWTWMHKTREFYQNGEPLSLLDSVLNRYDTVPGIMAWFTTNHDENSWNGTEYEKYGDAAGALAVFSATWKGIPLVYSGQEGPNKKRLAFFEKDSIEWNNKYELHEFYKTLFQLRSSSPALSADAPLQRLSTTDSAHVIAFLRKSGNEEVLVVLNLSKNKNLRFTITDGAVNGRFKNVFSGSAADFSSEKNFEMQDWEYLVYRKGGE